MSDPTQASNLDQSLQGVCLLEKDSNGDTIITWSHLLFKSASSSEYEAIVKSRSLINTTRLQSFSKFRDKWIYIASQVGPEKNQRILYFSVVLFASEFNPEKYGTLTNHMVNLYKIHNTPVKILECFLDVMTTTKHDGGVDSLGNKLNFNGGDYNKQDHLLASSVLDIVKMFEANTWMIWSALIMKKRIVVYSDALPTLLKFVRALPLFVLHRQDWSLLRPFVTTENEAEIIDLVKTGVYVAGFVDPQIKAREDLYDLFINLNNLDISTAPHAEDDFVQTQVHQDFAKMLTIALETEGMNDEKLIRGIKIKTNDLLTKLNALKSKQEGSDKGYISYASFQNQAIPPNMENFLYSVAVAEGMTKINA